MDGGDRELDNLLLDADRDLSDDGVAIILDERGHVEGFRPPLCISILRRMVPSSLGNWSSSRGAGSGDVQDSSDIEVCLPVMLPS